MFLAAPGDEQAQVELTHNWDLGAYTVGRNFGQLAYEGEDIYAACERLQQHGVTILRPPRDGRMALVRSPDQISGELLQQGAAAAGQPLEGHVQRRQLVRTCTGCPGPAGRLQTGPANRF